MRLISCYIANFGLHHEKKIDFTPGMNSFAWENGAGKTTLSVFIKAMLYGFGDNRTKKDENERKRYMPWQGGRYGGSITFEAGGRRFIAERSFGARQADDTFVLYDEKTGGVSNFYTENLGKELFGIDCDGFMRTVFWSEKSIPQDDRVSPSVASRLSDIMGADGDVGSYDKAINALDERRKLYQKRGGGEINELQAKISELKRQLDELELLARDAERVAGDLDAVRADIKTLSDEKEKLSDRLLEIEKIKARRKYQATYQGYVKDMEDEEAKVDELDRFFRGNPPTSAEIREIRLARAEADAIHADISTGGGASEELDRLSLMFGGGIGQVDIDDAELHIKAVKENEAALRELESGNDEYSREMRRLFPARVPTMAEIDENIKKAGERGPKRRTYLIYAGLALLAIGIGAGFIHPALFSICAMGVILSIVGFTGGKGGSGVADAQKFLNEIIPYYDGEPLGVLYQKKNDLERYEALDEARKQKITKLSESIAASRCFIADFFTRVGVDATYPEITIKDVKQSYIRYSALLLSEERSASDRFIKRKREGELRTRISDFCRRYPTVTADPITEIEEKARDRSYHAELLAEKRNACEQFKLEYGISDEAVAFDEGEEYRICERMQEIDETLGERRRTESALAARYSSITARLDTEVDIRTEIEQKEDRLKVCRRNLSIIEKTKALLELAHENMTLRYTGRTQERFLHYMSVITEEVGEYRLDTDFMITKSEGGSLRTEELYSRGTRELYSLAMRLALTDSLYEGELPFLVLDDPFIAYDDARGKRARGLLSAIAKERQILYFTCSNTRDI